MIQLNYLQKLLGGVDVEWLPLGNLAEIGTGKSNRQDETEDGEYPFYVRSKNILRSSTFQFDEKAIVVPGEGGIGDIFHFVEGKYALHQRAYRIKATSDVLDTKFLYHFMSSKFKQYILMKSVGATSISIRKPMLEGFQIPIPCPDNQEKSLAIQVEIVRILDAFTAMTAELTAELNMRKKQYSHYQFELLKFTETTQQLTIGECCDINKGATPIKKATPGKYPLVATTEERQSSSEYQFDCPAVCVPLISSRGHGVASIDRIYYQDGKFALGNILCAITPKDSEVLSAKFLRYYLFDKKDVLLVPLMRGGANVSLTMDSLKKVKIPIPPIADQQRIVRALDKFDEFVKALPREIELRQKQYEYYRDLLLSFPASPAGGPKSHSDEAA